MILFLILKIFISYRKISIFIILIEYLKIFKKEWSVLKNDFIILSCEGFMCNFCNVLMNFIKIVLKYKELIEDIEKENKIVLKNYM